MSDELQPSTPERSLFALAPIEPEWRPILHASNQVVLYNPTSHALSIRQHRTPPGPKTVVKRSFDHRCPYCHRALPHEESSEEEDAELELVDSDLEDHPRSRVPNYFQLLQVANETTSVPSTPSRRSSPSHSRNSSPDRAQSSTSDVPFRADSMAEGYFSAFFQEESRLGMGANGSVYLCQHVLDGNPLGHFAVKKIAVGQSHSYLLNTLREVRLLEQLHHPNIIQYHHSWLESSQFSSFGPKVPTLHMLMQWAEGGSLDDFIDGRLGRRSPVHIHPASASTSEDPTPQTGAGQPLSRGARIRAFRAMQRASPEEREKIRREMAGEIFGSNTRRTGDWKAVHLLSAEEVKSLFQDVVEGLSFLHDKSILHLDLKPGNVLLTWDEGRLIPRAMLSDFGTSQDMLNSRTRSGNTGTLEYASPESLPNPSGILAQVDSKADMWSLGMILHKLLFFQLPYKHASDSSEKADSKVDGKATMDLLEKEVLAYPGFKSSRTLETTFSSRRLPPSFLVLLETLLHVNPLMRPSSERVVTAIREGRFDPVPAGARARSGLNLVPAIRRAQFENHNEGSPDSLNTPTELPLWTDNDAQETPTEGEEKVPFLGLPAPAPPEFEYMKLRLWNQEYPLTRTTAKLAVKRTIKSGLLVWKVRTLSAMFREASADPSLLTFAFALAFVDTWSEQLSASAALGAAHLGLVQLARWLH